MSRLFLRRVISVALLAKFDQPGYDHGLLMSNSAAFASPTVKVTRRTLPRSGDRSGDHFLDLFNGYTFATENKKMKEVEGVLIAYSFSQRIEMVQGAAFAEYTVKDVKLNQPMGDDVFAIPN